MFLAGPDGPRRTVQIVIYGHAREQPTVRWSFPPYPAGAGGAARPRGGAGIAAEWTPENVPLYDAA